jgi:hypothetical protein
MTNTSVEPRKPIPPAVETQVLVDSRRRCCLCFHLDDDIGRKQGQIAHVDRNRKNHTESNLAFLCLPHHDEYDSRTSQSKGITKDELLHAKTSLLAYVKEHFSSDTVSISIKIKGDFDRLTDTQQKELLAQALGAANIKNQITVQSVSRGSVIFRIQTTADDAAAILEAFNTGRLTEIGVIEVLEAPTPLKNVSFSEGFSKYSHGVEKREVARTVLTPDSAAFFDGSMQTTPGKAAFGLYLRRVHEKYSLLVIADQSSVVSGAFPIAHCDVPLQQGVSPYQALVLLVEKFGIAIQLDGTQAKLRIGERIRLPREMSDMDFVRFLESRAEESSERYDYELVCLMERGIVFSNYRLVHIMFALSKHTYFSSLANIGLRIERGPLGRFVSRKPRT